MLSHITSVLYCKHQLLVTDIGTESQGVSVVQLMMQRLNKSTHTEKVANKMLGLRLWTSTVSLLSVTHT